MKLLPLLLALAATTSAFAAKPSPVSDELKAAESEYYRIITLPTPDGVTMLPLSKQGTVVGAWPTKKLKSEKLFVPKYRKALGQ